MKKIVYNTLLLLLVLTTGGLKAQNHQYVVDSAEYVVQRYLKLLNIDNGFPADSVLYIESYIYSTSNPHDTIVMKRWQALPLCERIELWHNDTLQIGYISNTKDFYRYYNTERHEWAPIAPEGYYIQSDGYHFQGSLYYWKTDGSELEYTGIWHFNNHDVYRILVKRVDKYDRYCMFEKESGLLFLIDEQAKKTNEMIHVKENDLKWRAFHEFVPVGRMLLPSQESYQADNKIVLIFHNYQFLPGDKKYFNKEER